MEDICELLELNKFEKKLFEAARYNLKDKENSLRASNYAYALRALLDGYVDRKSPAQSVLECDWYKNTSSPHIEKHVSNKQKYYYLFRAELSDSEISHIGIAEYLDKAINDLQNQYKVLCSLTHISTSTFPLDDKQINTQTRLADEVLEQLASTYSACIEGVHEKLKEKYINDAVVSAFVSEYIESLAEISGRYSVEMLDIASIKIVDIRYGQVTLEINGSVDVELMWGKGEDEASLDQNFPMSATCSCSIGDWENFHVASCNVDTSSWYGVDDDEEAA